MKMRLLLQQQQAIAHLREWKVGALFMEPGTGKTRIACEIANAIPDIDLVVWIAPLHTIRPKEGMEPISAEIEKWGGFKAETFYIGFESLQASDRIYHELLGRIEESTKPFVIVDESLKIKNAEAKRTKRLLHIGEMVEYKLILNGTPLSRNLLDLWSQMEFISPKILNMSLAEFKNTFCEYTTVTKRIGNYRVYSKEFITGYENVDYLYSLIRHYVYECDLTLNITQNYHDLRYTISEEESKEYYFLKEKYLDDETLQWKNNNIFMEMTQKMQHSYCLAGGKFEALDALFKSVPQNETIIFCKYIDSREECERRYPKAQVLSYQKESFGLNLQKFHYTVYFDKIWDLALRIQSGRRTFRTGQEQDCQYYDLTGNIGLESLIDRNIEKKVSMTEYFKGKTKEQIRNEL
ncbi:MAG: DEAD/DEAH box helicase [Bacteroidales bacterium]|nr:DEAD/DEAH box helicase [Bacteroidales bacterium]